MILMNEMRLSAANPVANHLSSNQKNLTTRTDSPVRGTVPSFVEHGQPSVPAQCAEFPQSDIRVALSPVQQRRSTHREYLRRTGL